MPVGVEARGRFQLPEDAVGQRYRTTSSPAQSKIATDGGSKSRLSLHLRSIGAAEEGRASSRSASVSDASPGKIARTPMRSPTSLSAGKRTSLRAAGAASLSEQTGGQAREILGKLDVDHLAKSLPVTSLKKAGGLSSLSRRGTDGSLAGEHAASALVKSYSETNLSQRLFALADRKSNGKVGFQDFAWLHWKLISCSDQYSNGTVDQNGWQFPHHAFRKVDLDHNLVLDENEWLSYTDDLASVLGKHNLKDVCKGVLREEADAPALGRYSEPVSRQLLERVTCAQHLGMQHAELLESLLDQHADPNKSDAQGNSVLMHASAKSDPQLLEKLLMRGGNASLNNKSYESPALAAAKARQPECLRLLLFGKRSGACSSKELVEEEKLSCSLVDKMPELSPKEVRDLALRGADVNFRSSQGWTPLIAAVFWGRQECVECLLRLSATSPKIRLNLNGRDARGRSAMHIAARKGKALAISALVTAKADVNLQDQDGWTPLHHATFNSQSESVVALISAGADLHVKDLFGFTPYMLTISPDRTEATLSKEALELLQPPDAVNFARRLLPILKDASLTPYEKVDQLLNLPGVRGQFANLRFYDQMFSRVRGPSKVQLAKFWELLCDKMFKRLRSEKTDVDTHHPDLSDEERAERLEEHRQRLQVQRRFAKAWIEESRGPPRSDEWTWDNREGYREALSECVREEVEAFKKKSALACNTVKARPGYEDLAALPLDEVLLPQYLDQRAAHGGMEWLEAADTVSAFEALRDVQALGDKGDRDDREALTRFMDLINSDTDFGNGPAFWQNVYKLWLERYARLVNTDFQAKVRRFVASYSEETGHQAHVYSPPSKSYASIKAREGRFGKPGYEGTEDRAVASRILDVVRCSITMDTPEAIVGLVKAFREAGSKGSTWGKLELVRLSNGFNPEAEGTPEDCARSVTLYVLYHGGVRNVPRTDGQLKVSIVGEVKLLLPEFLTIKKSMHPLSRFLQEEDFEEKAVGHQVSTPSRPSRRKRSSFKMPGEEAASRS